MNPDHPMSASYPQESGKIELRRILKALEGNKMERKLETQIELQEDKPSFLESIKKSLWQEDNDSNIEVDEVDGRREEILKPIVKLYFLKIIFIDIGISFGDLVTDIAQGLNLIFDNNWNVHWSTFQYGCIVLALLWLPVLPMLLHIASSKTMKYFTDSENYLKVILHVILFVIFFPLLPTLMYTKILFLRRSYTTNREKLKFMEYEQKANDLKSIVGSIESTLQFTLMLWMISRGILTLPWNQSLSSSCIEDSLGRIACLPSIPMLSLLFSLLSILKSAMDMNIVPYVRSSLNSAAKSRVCYHFVLCFFPFFLCNVLYRLPAYAFIITYIDYWSFIPASILYVLHLGVCGVFFIKQENLSHDDDLPMDNLMNESSGTINPVNTDDDGNTGEVDRLPNGLVWNGNEWMSKSTCQRQSEDEVNECVPRFLSKTEIEITREEDLVVTNEYRFIDNIDEKNSPLLLNSIIGFFYPSVYSTLVIPHKKEILTILHEYQSWQMKVLKVQITLFNSVTLITITTIFILVTFVESFNYKTTILDNFWFSSASFYLMFMGLSSSIWVMRIFPKQFTLDNGEKEMKEKEKNVGLNIQRRRHLTGDSNNGSIQSATASFLEAEKGPGKMKFRLLFCALSTIIVLIPSTLGVLLYKIIPKKEVFIMKIHQSKDNINLNMIMTHDNFNIDEDSTLYNIENILIINATDQLKNFNKKLVVFVDTRPINQWRLSSPISIPVHEFQSLIVKDVDWRNSKLNNDDGALVTTRIISMTSSFVDRFSDCSANSIISINGKKDAEGTIFQRKIFSEGKLYEQWKIKSNCHSNGQDCQYDFDESAKIECKNLIFNDEVNFEDNSNQLQKVKFQNGEHMNIDYCCKNYSTLIEVYGKSNVGLQILNEDCTFSRIFEEKSKSFGIKTLFKLCQVGDFIIRKSFRTDQFNNIMAICNENDYVCDK